MKPIISAVISSALPGTAPAYAQSMQFPPNDSRLSAAGAATNFTRAVIVAPLVDANGDIHSTSGIVAFGSGARTACYAHPPGQSLIVTFGCGRVQRGGGRIGDSRPGDVVWFPPDEKHWHGPTTTTAMMHIAVQESQDGKNVEWMQKVSDEQQTDAGSGLEVQETDK